MSGKKAVRGRADSIGSIEEFLKRKRGEEKGQAEGEIEEEEKIEQAKRRNTKTVRTPEGERGKAMGGEDKGKEMDILRDLILDMRKEK